MTKMMQKKEYEVNIMPVTVKEILDDYRRAKRELRKERKEKADSIKLGTDARTPQH